MSRSAEAAQQKWERVREALTARLGATDFRVWFAGAELAFVDGVDVGISLPSKFIRDYVDREYRDVVRRYWERELPGLETLNFVVRGTGEGDAAPSQAAPADVFRLSRYPDVRLLDFVVGDGNRLAWDEVNRLASAAKGSRVEPLFLYAPSGMGKTHLLLGAGMKMQAGGPGGGVPAVAYIPADLFVMHVIQAAREERLRDFRQSVLASEVLLVDGLQLLDGKGWAGDELLLVIELGVSFGKPVILAADRALTDLGKAGERLAVLVPPDRVVDLGGSDAALRSSILAGRAATGSFQIEMEATQVFAERFKGNHRTMLDALAGAYSGLKPPRPLNVADVQSLLAGHFPGGAAPISLQRIQQVVARELEVTVRDLQAASRKAGIARARQIAMYLAREFSGASLREIGASFGGRDHTTVVNAISVVEAAIISEPDTAAAIEALRSKFLACC